MALSELSSSILYDLWLRVSIMKGLFFSTLRKYDGRWNWLTTPRGLLETGRNLSREQNEARDCFPVLVSCVFQVRFVSFEVLWILKWDTPIFKSGTKWNDFQLIPFQDYLVSAFYGGGNFWIDYNSKQLLFYSCQGALLFFS